MLIISGSGLLCTHVPNQIKYRLSSICLQLNHDVQYDFTWNSLEGVYTAKEAIIGLLVTQAVAFLQAWIGSGFGGCRLQRRSNSSFGLSSMTQILLCLPYTEEASQLQQHVLVVVTLRRTSSMRLEISQQLFKFGMHWVLLTIPFLL